MFTFVISCGISGGSMVGLMVTSSKRAYAIPRSAASRTLPLQQATADHTSTGDTQTLKGRSGSVSVGSPGVHKVLSKPSECLWWVWGLILNAIFAPPIVLLGLLLCPWTCGFFFWWDPTFSPVNDCSTVRCNFGVLTEEGEHISFYSAIF